MALPNISIHYRRIPSFINHSRKLLVFLLSLNLILSSNLFLGSHNSVDSWTIFNTASVESEEENYFGSRPMDFDRTDIPRNILVGSYIGGIGHLRPALEIGKILIRRGYNVALVAPGNFTPSPEYQNIRQFSTGPKFDTKVLPVYQKLFAEEYTFKKFKLQRKLSNSEYLSRFQVYMRAAAEFKPDLFFCDFLMNEVCYDVAWKLRKPVVGISAGLTRK
ncbi:9243_t:CDS:2 [Acaulospora colombiana]|uniref:9243_t:CDS:1 n=1 Tax=Acaulospora colombiana TaxID=27376 RepID=A0ACA9KQP7_9GLOM|nr:9243_t:CDS:2 [Acaulospora colombiana]